MDDRLDPSSHGWRNTRLTNISGSRWLGPLAFTVVFAACAEDSPNRQGAGSSGGAQLYADRCASCHGSDLRGTDVGPALLSEIYEPNHHPDDSFRAAVRNGVTPHHWQFGPMPAITGLDDDEITAIITYIREVQQRDGLEPYPPK